MSVPISDLVYSTFRQGVRNWIEQDLKWKREEIISCNIQYEIIRTDASEEQWRKYRHGKHVDVILERITQEKQKQRFIRLDSGDWQKKA